MSGRSSQVAQEDMLGSRMEPALQAKLLREVHRVAKIGTWEVTADEQLLWSEETFDLFGVKRSDFTGSIDEFFSLVHPDDLEGVKRLEDFEDSQDEYFKSDYRIVRSDGEVRHMRQTAIILRDSLGAPRGFSGMVQDVSDQVETEAKLRQAQKMETIGHLSGGIAHDFNNILAAVMAAAELLAQQETFERELVENIISSAQRGAQLTQSLLAFARKRRLHSVQVDVVKTVTSVAPMLDRMIGSDIHLELDLAPETWTIDADLASLEESLVNLTLNAREAITGPGKITLSCGNKTRLGRDNAFSDYVEVAVTDSGLGMTDAVLQQASDPFFTTKPVGKGSGLGLSMVEGFANQSGGEMHIVSGPGRGTAVSLWMPKSLSYKTSAAKPPEDVCSAEARRVLIVEDNEDLASLLKKQLTSLDYRVSVATNRQDACRQVQAQAGFDIVLCDILLADGDRGPSVVKDLLTIDPSISPVFMTGFSGDCTNGSTHHVAEALILRKPFSIKTLAATLTRVLRARPDRDV